MSVPKRVKDAIARARELAPVQDDVSEFMTFTPREFDDERLTAVVDVTSKSSGAPLGVIKWYGAWHQYAFFPCDGCLFNGRCLADIYDVLGRMMRKRKEMKRAAPKAGPKSKG